MNKKEMMLRSEIRRLLRKKRNARNTSTAPSISAPGAGRVQLSEEKLRSIARDRFREELAMQGRPSNVVSESALRRQIRDMIRSGLLVENTVTKRGWMNNSVAVKKIQKAMLDKAGLEQGGASAAAWLGCKKKEKCPDGAWGPKTSGLWLKLGGKKDIPDTIDDAMTALEDLEARDLSQETPPGSGESGGGGDDAEDAGHWTEGIDTGEESNAYKWGAMIHDGLKGADWSGSGEEKVKGVFSRLNSDEKILAAYAGFKAVLEEKGDLDDGDLVDWLKDDGMHEESTKVDAALQELGKSRINYEGGEEEGDAEEGATDYSALQPDQVSALQTELKKAYATGWEAGESAVGDEFINKMNGFLFRAIREYTDTSGPLAGKAYDNLKPFELIASAWSGASDGFDTQEKRAVAGLGYWNGLMFKWHEIGGLTNDKFHREVKKLSNRTDGGRHNLYRDIKKLAAALGFDGGDPNGEEIVSLLSANRSAGSISKLMRTIERDTPTSFKKFYDAIYELTDNLESGIGTDPGSNTGVLAKLKNVSLDDSKPFENLGVWGETEKLFHATGVGKAKSRPEGFGEDL
jgi:hypothetical protein